MPGWKCFIVAVLAAGLLLAAGCSAPENGTPGASMPTSGTESKSEDVPYKATEAELIQLKKTLQNFVKGLDDKTYSMIYQARGGNFADLKNDAAYDSLQVLGKSNGWTICLWRESLTVEHEDVLFMGKYAVEVHEFYYPYEHGIYVIQGDEVISLPTACMENVIDQEAVYHMLPEDMQWGLKADHPAINNNPSLHVENCQNA